MKWRLVFLRRDKGPLRLFSTPFLERNNFSLGGQACFRLGGRQTCWAIFARLMDQKKVLEFLCIQVVSWLHWSDKKYMLIQFPSPVFQAMNFENYSAFNAFSGENCPPFGFWS